MPRQFNKRALLAGIAKVVESATDEASSLKTEPYHMSGGKPSGDYPFDIYFVGTETLQNLDRIIDAFWEADNLLHDSIPREEIKDGVVDLVRQSLATNQPVTTTDIDEFFSALRKDPEHEWEIFRPLFGATIGGPRWAARLPRETGRLFQRSQRQRQRLRRWSVRGFAGPVRSLRQPTRGFAGPVRLGLFTVYDPQGHAAALAAAYPNCSTTEIERRLRYFQATKAVVSVVHGHVESPTDGQLMVPIRGEPADGSPSPAHAKAVPRQGELVLQGAGAGPSAL